MFRAQGPNNVTGYWEVDESEPDCGAYWSWYKDLVREYVDPSLSYLSPIKYYRAVLLLGPVNG